MSAEVLDPLISIHMMAKSLLLIRTEQRTMLQNHAQYKECCQNLQQYQPVKLNDLELRAFDELRLSLLILFFCFKTTASISISVCELLGHFLVFLCTQLSYLHSFSIEYMHLCLDFIAYVFLFYALLK